MKIIAGFDDTMVHIPVCANVTKTKSGRKAFAVGVFLAITLAILFSLFFGSIIKSFQYANYISAGLIFLLVLSIYFNWFNLSSKKELEKKVEEIKKISAKRFFKLLSIGFFVALATILDDIIVYSALFIGDSSNFPFVILGIFFATILQLSVLIYFSKKFMKIKYKKEITMSGLIILGMLILFGVL